MKVLIVGGSGLIGSAVAAELGKRHEIIVAGHAGGDVQVDIASRESIKAMFQTVGKVDAVIATVGKVVFAPLSDMTAEKYQVGLNHKLMGQVELVLEGIEALNDNGSFTLTTGILNHDPIPQGSSAAMVNGAIEGFVIGSALELPRGIRINAVSPTVIEEAMEAYAPFFRGYEPIPAAIAALGFSKSVEGLQTGKIIKIGF
jgi:NAD(P)-dependent dehydrogenase (short-subunit alcohol dehydrogenase family)